MLLPVNQGLGRLIDMSTLFPMFVLMILFQSVKTDDFVKKIDKNYEIITSFAILLIKE